MGTDDNWAGWNRGEPPPPVPDFLPASDATRGGTRASAGIIRALQNTLQFLQSSSTDPGGFVPPTSYQSEEPELVSAMVALLRELEALKSRDASSATVLRMAKENLDQRKEQIADLQAELQARGQAVSAVSQGLQDQDRKMQEFEQRERDANSKIKKLQEKIQDQQKDVKDNERLTAEARDELRKAEARKSKLFCWPSSIFTTKPAANLTFERLCTGAARYAAAGAREPAHGIRKEATRAGLGDGQAAAASFGRDGNDPQGASKTTISQKGPRACSGWR